MGLQLHLLACWLRQGLKLAEALPRVRRFLPRSVEALLLYGYTNGRLPEVLPVAQKELQELAEQPSNHRQDLISVLGTAFGVLLVGSILFAFVLPKFEAIMWDMEVEIPWIMVQLREHEFNFVQIHLCIVALMVASYFFVLAGPAARTWMECKHPNLADRIQNLFGFQRMLNHHRFGRVLARLLDAGVREDEALIVAGTVTASSRLRSQVEKAVEELRGGAGLMSALKTVKLNDDFYFRLNAAKESGRPLTEALEDWLEAVRARAEFRERVAVNITSASFILYSSLLVGAFGWCFFHMEIQLIEGLLLW